MLMMVDPHVHFHVIPRYSEARQWDGIAFPDAGWPGPPRLDTAVKLDKRQLQDARDRRLLNFRYRCRRGSILTCIHLSGGASFRHRGEKKNGELASRSPTPGVSLRETLISAGLAPAARRPARRKCRTGTSRSSRAGHFASRACSATKSCSSAQAFSRSSRATIRAGGRSSHCAFPAKASCRATALAEYGIQAIVRSEVMVGKAEDFDPIVDTQSGDAALLLAPHPAQRGDRLRMAGQLRPARFHRASCAPAVRNRSSHARPRTARWSIRSRNSRLPTSRARRRLTSTAFSPTWSGRD